MDIQHLLDTHEQYKSKWLQQNEEGLFNRIVLWEAMLDAITEYKSKYQEDKQQLEVEEWIRFINLQNEKVESVDKKWETSYKNKYTVDSAKAIISQEFYDKRCEIQVLKLKTELLQNKTTVISEYINIIKMNIKK